MKNFSLLLALFSLLSLSAQNQIADDIAALQSAKAEFKSFSVLTASSTQPNEEISATVTNATIAVIDHSGVNSIVALRPQTIKIQIPYNGTLIPVLLYKAEIANEAFTVSTDKASNVPYQLGAHYRGIIQGDATSLVAMNFFNNEMSGIVSSHSLNNLVIGKIDKAFNTSEYIIYSDENMLIPNGFRCDVKEDDQPIEDSHDHRDASRSVASVKCVTLYFEIDYDLYLANNSNVTTTTNWMTSVFNNVQTLFANDGISTALRSIYIWTEDDPYTGDSSSDYLYQFKDLRPVFDADMGQLVSIDPGGLGGVAFLNGVCNQNNYSYSDVNLSFNTVPTYSWTIQVITHELGHQMGSRHTHACAWNGNNTAIDGCGQQAGYTEGGCATGPIPSIGIKGTIMSYCHLISGVGIAFNNGFGTQPKNVILATVNNGSCLSSDCVNACINTVANFEPIQVTNNSVTVSWNDVGSTTTWQVAILPINGIFANYITKTTTSH
ncbi:MAG: hypothetical protein ITG00_03965, partial [Flavobacterium sp.]|nr:hypothetical protein [Flavobacterium sp.]